LGCSWTTYLSG